jgi:hypothetical protein
MESRNLIDFLSFAVLNSVVGMPLGKVSGFYLDLVLSSKEETVCLIGAACDLPDRTEAFYLSTGDSDPVRRWMGPDGEPAWEAVDLLEGGKLLEWAGAFGVSRTVRCYFDSEDRDRGLPIQGPLSSAAAIEFRPSGDIPADRLVIYATPEYPCAIELATTPERCDEILGRLKEFTP